MASGELAAAVARSAVVPAPPVAVIGGWEVSGRHSTADLRITDCSPLNKCRVRAATDGRVARALGVGFGRARRDDGVLVAGVAPEQWLLLAPPGRDPAAVLDDVDRDGPLVTVLDVTHARTLLRLTGATAAAVLSTLCAIDLSDDVTPDGTVLATRLADIGAELIRDDAAGERSYLIGCDRSYGQYLLDALCGAGAEHGIDVDGFRLPGI